MVNLLRSSLLLQKIVTLVLIGLFLAILLPSQPFGWCILNFLIFSLAWAILVIPHEIGHAIMAYLMGDKVLKITIGSRKSSFTLRILGLNWEVCQSPLCGRTFVIPQSIHFYRLKTFIVTLGGPLVDFLMLTFVLQLPRQVIFFHLPGIYIFPGLCFLFANVVRIITNIFPYYSQIDGERIPNDGMRLITRSFLPQQKIREEASLWQVFEGNEWMERGDYQQAIMCYSKAINFDPNCVTAYQGRSQLYSLTGEYKRGLADINLLFNLEPLKATSYLYSGIVYFHGSKNDSNKLAKVISDIDLAIRLAEKDESISLEYILHMYSCRATIHLYSGDEIKSIADFTKVIQMQGNSDSYYNRGVSYYQYNNCQAALDDFDRAIKLDKVNTAAYYSRGNARYQIGDNRGAFQDYERAQSLNLSKPIHPRDEHGFYAKGLARLHLGDPVGALEDFQKAESLCAEHANTSLVKLVREAIASING